MRQRMNAGLGSFADALYGAGADLANTMPGPVVAIGDWLFAHPFGLLGPNLDKSKTINSAIYGKFPSPAAPPPVGVPADVTTPPASGADAQAQIDFILNQNARDWQAQNQTLLDSVDTTTSVPWYVWLGLGLAGVVAAKEALA